MEHINHYIKMAVDNINDSVDGDVITYDELLALYEATMAVV